MNKYKKFMLIKYLPWKSLSLSLSLSLTTESKQFFITNVYVDRNWWHKKENIRDKSKNNFSFFRLLVICAIIAMQFHKSFADRKWYIKVTIVSAHSEQKYSKAIIVIVKLKFFLCFFPLNISGFMQLSYFLLLADGWWLGATFISH